MLVIDDNDDMRSMLHTMLELAGFQVATARDGEQALALLARQPADAVICDIFMPDKDGIETILDIRRRHPEAKIIAMSGWRSDFAADYLGVARDIGAHYSLRKPFDPPELEAILRKLLE